VAEKNKTRQLRKKNTVVRRRTLTLRIRIVTEHNQNAGEKKLLMKERGNKSTDIIFLGDAGESKEKGKNPRKLWGLDAHSSHRGVRKFFRDLLTEPVVQFISNVGWSKVVVQRGERTESNQDSRVRKEGELQCQNLGSESPSFLGGWRVILVKFQPLHEAR